MSEGEQKMSVTPLPGPIRQIGYVVRDLDTTLKSWLHLGVGPWYVLRNIPQRARYRDGAVCDVTLSIALANSGDLQIELVQQHGDAPSIYTEFLADGREGFHQIAYWAEDFEQAVAAGRAAGWPVVWEGLDEGGVRYAYLEPPAGTVAIIEVMELNEITNGMAAFVRDAAAGWDGTDPIRPLN
jgi:hypothetical protein